MTLGTRRSEYSLRIGGSRITAAGVGTTIAWLGTVAGLLAFATVLLMRDVTVASPAAPDRAAASRV
jgi:hypothetical protein